MRDLGEPFEGRGAFKLSCLVFVVSIVSLCLSAYKLMFYRENIFRHKIYERRTQSLHASVVSVGMDQVASH